MKEIDKREYGIAFVPQRTVAEATVMLAEEIAALRQGLAWLLPPRAGNIDWVCSACGNHILYGDTHTCQGLKMWVARADKEG